MQDYWTLIPVYLNSNECILLTSISQYFNNYIKNHTKLNINIKEQLTKKIFHSILKYKKVINCNIVYNLEFTKKNSNYIYQICNNWKYIEYINFDNCYLNKCDIIFLSKNSKSLINLSISNTFIERFIYNELIIENIKIQEQCDNIYNYIYIYNDNQLENAINELQLLFNKDYLTNKISAYNAYINLNGYILNHLLLSKKINFIIKHFNKFNFNNNIVCQLIRNNNILIISKLFDINYSFPKYIWNQLFLFNKDYSIINKFIKEDVPFIKNEIFNHIFDKIIINQYDESDKISLQYIKYFYSKGAIITKLFMIKIVKNLRYDVLEWIYENNIDISKFYSYDYKFRLNDSYKINQYTFYNYNQKVKECLFHNIVVNLKNKINIFNNTFINKTYNILCKLKLNPYESNIILLDNKFVSLYLIEKILKIGCILLEKKIIADLLNNYKANNILYISYDYLNIFDEDEWIYYIKKIPSIKNSLIINYTIYCHENNNFKKWCYDFNKYKLISYFNNYNSCNKKQKI